jgi:MFS transporter, FSR family, fosmidomycin resistance protein
VSQSTIAVPYKAPSTAFPVLGAISFCHMLNDMMQALLLASYPLLKSGFNLSFGQIGLLTLVFQCTASLLQPLIGLYTDRKPQPYSLPVGMAFSVSGLVILGKAPDYAFLLCGAVLLGVGSSIFHPESSRIARLASGGRHGLAQSVFQVGGNFGQALGPLIVAFLVLPNGRGSLAWFGCFGLLGMVILGVLGSWYKTAMVTRVSAKHRNTKAPLSKWQATRAIAVLMALMFSKFFYLASFISYYIFYLMQRFSLRAEDAQVDLFVFLTATALGTVVGGPIGDRFGRKHVIWGSILGVLPFTLILPHVGLTATIVLSVVIGLILSSAFSAIVVYAQEILPGRVGMVSGMFFGLAFGLGGIGAAVLGELADWTSIGFVYQLCAFLPAIGLLTVFLPNLRSLEVR